MLWHFYSLYGDLHPDLAAQAGRTHPESAEVSEEDYYAVSEKEKLQELYRDGAADRGERSSERVAAR